MVALDKKTGKQVWKAEGKRLSLSFSTPALIKSGDHMELVVAMPGDTLEIRILAIEFLHTFGVNAFSPGM